MRASGCEYTPNPGHQVPSAVLLVPKPKRAPGAKAAQHPPPPHPPLPKNVRFGICSFQPTPLFLNTQTRTSSGVQKPQPQNLWKGDSSPSSRRAPVWEAASAAGAVDHPDSPAARRLPASAPRPTRRAPDQTRDEVAASAPAALGPR